MVKFFIASLGEILNGNSELGPKNLYFAQINACLAKMNDFFAKP